MSDAKKAPLSASASKWKQEIKHEINKIKLLYAAACNGEVSKGEKGEQTRKSGPASISPLA
jgi:hypothetical protein